MNWTALSLPSPDWQPSCESHYKPCFHPIEVLKNVYGGACNETILINIEWKFLWILLLLLVYWHQNKYCLRLPRSVSKKVKKLNVFIITSAWAYFSCCPPYYVPLTVLLAFQFWFFGPRQWNRNLFQFIYFCDSIKNIAIIGWSVSYVTWRSRRARAGEELISHHVHCRRPL